MIIDTFVRYFPAIQKAQYTNGHYRCGFIAWLPWFPFTPLSHYVISCPSHAEMISLDPTTLLSIITTVYVFLCFGL